jgi:hypothetical protein
MCKLIVWDAELVVKPSTSEEYSYKAATADAVGL